MDSLLRPAARDALWRWREILAGGAVVLLGLWWAARAFGIMMWLGFAVAALGVMILVTGVQRMRFARGGGGAGVVEINERRIAYLGPLSGGVVDIDDLASLELDPTGHPAHWRLRPQVGAPVVIPVDAEGADGLFDAFAALPGIRTERMLEALNSGPAASVLVWQAKADGPRLLH
jgi:hypothetical protein